MHSSTNLRKKRADLHRSELIGVQGRSMAGLYADGLAWASDELDALIAARSLAPLLITAPSIKIMAGVARQVHAASPRPAAPFKQLNPSDFSSSEDVVLAQWDLLRRQHPTATLFLPMIEAVPRNIQDTLANCIGAGPRDDGGAVRVIAGTTVSLVHYVEAGRFSDTLFYRLNCIHLEVSRPHRSQVRKDRHPRSHRRHSV